MMQNAEGKILKLLIWFESGNGLTRVNEFFGPLVDKCRKENPISDHTDPKDL